MENNYNNDYNQNVQINEIDFNLEKAKKIKTKYLTIFLSILIGGGLVSVGLIFAAFAFLGLFGVSILTLFLPLINANSVYLVVILFILAFLVTTVEIVLLIIFGIKAYDAHKNYTYFRNMKESLLRQQFNSQP